MGYVGLVTGATLAHIGHQVVCVDRDEERISALKESRMPFYEPGLKEMVSHSVHHERLSWLSLADSDSLTRLVGEADVIFISVDTPQGGDGSADLSSVAAVARSIGRVLAQEEGMDKRRERPLLVVNKSTG